MANPAEMMPMPQEEGKKEESDLLEDLAKDADKETAKTDEAYYEEISVEKNDPEANEAYMKDLKKRVKRVPVSKMSQEQLLERFNAMMEKAHAKGGPLGERMVQAALDSPEAKRLRELEQQGPSKVDVPELREKLRKMEEEKKVDELREMAGLPKKEKPKAEIPPPPGYPKEQPDYRKMGEASGEITTDTKLPDTGIMKAGGRLETEHAKRVAFKTGQAEFLDPTFDVRGYEAAMNDVAELPKLIAEAGFFKRFSLRRRLKKAKATLKGYEDQITDLRLDMEKDKRAAGAPQLSESEKKKQAKRQSSRWGMSGGPRY